VYNYLLILVVRDYVNVTDLLRGLWHSSLYYIETDLKRHFREWFCYILFFFADDTINGKYLGVL
jgi:hypothetical protein